MGVWASPQRPQYQPRPQKPQAPQKPSKYNTDDATDIEVKPGKKPAGIGYTKPVKEEHKQGVAEEYNQGSSEATAKQVYQYLIQKIPGFMYTAPTADVKKAISKAMSFGPQISVPDLASYAYGILKTNDLDEGEKNTSYMNKQNQDFYNKNPNFKRDDRGVKFVGNQLASIVTPTNKPGQIAKKPMTPFRTQGVEEGNHPFRGVGGAFDRGDDERHDLDPTDWYIVKDGEMFLASIYPNDVQQAIAQGFSRTEAKATP